MLGCWKTSSEAKSLKIIRKVVPTKIIAQFRPRAEPINDPLSYLFFLSSGVAIRT